MKVLVSACLVGLNTQWDGGSSKVDGLFQLVKSGQAVYLCPEQLGGLSTPREPAEIEPGKTASDVLAGGARVITITGRDVTAQYVAGAQRVLAFCQEIGIETAVLFATSPACGARQTYDGTHTGTLRPGRGVAAELLAQNGVEVYNQLDDLGSLPVRL
jgi:uncharacterized protein YbbK (DUF523 family)